MVINNPKITVIIPTHNRAHLLSRAIESVLKQTYGDFEIIVIDDSSNDNTEEIAKYYTNVGENIRYIRNTVNVGAAAARNQGINMAEGEYIAFLDDDDEWVPEKLKKQIEKFGMSTSNVGVVSCGYMWINDITGDTCIFTPELKGHIHDALLQRDCVGANNCLIRKSFLLSVRGFDESLPSRQDWDLWIRLSNICQFDFVPEVLMKLHVHGEQISTNLIKKIKGTEMVYNKIKDEHGIEKRVLANHMAIIGKLYGQSGQNKRARKYLFNSIRKNPFNWKTYVHLLLAVLCGSYYKNILIMLYKYRNARYYIISSQ